MRFIVNPYDEVNLLRILNYPKRNIGATSADRLIRYSAKTELPLWNLLLAPEQVPELNLRTVEAIGEFVDLLEKYRRRFRQPLHLSTTLRELLEAEAVSHD
mgnify:CR=1 FL=1